MALPTNDSSERDSRPPSPQSVHSGSSKAASRRPSPVRGVTPPLSAMETLASLRAKEAGPPKDTGTRDKSRSPPPPQYGHGHQPHYYPYPPPPPPHLYNGVPPFENGQGQWGRVMPPPPPPADRRDHRGSESPAPGTPGTPAYGPPGIPGYPHHNHDPHYPPPHFSHSPYGPHPYTANLNPSPPIYGGVQTTYTFSPVAGVTSYSSHPGPAPYGPNGHGILSGNNYPNGVDTNLPLPPSDANNDVHVIGPGAAVPGSGFAAISSPLTHTPIPESEIIYTEDAATKVTDRIRRRCYNCYTSDTSTWRRSNLAVGKVLCNKCGLFERTHSRPRPEQFPHKRTSLNGEGDPMSPSAPPTYNLTSATPQSQQSLEPKSTYEGGDNVPMKRSKKAKLDHGRTSDGAPPAAQIPHYNGMTVPSHSPLPPLPPPHIVSNPASYSPQDTPTSQLPAGLAHLTHPHPPQHQPYYGNHNSNGAHSSSNLPTYSSHPPPAHSSPGPAHAGYGGGAYGPPLQYNYPGLGPGGHGGGSNGYALPPINGSVGQYEYENPHPPPPRAGGVPVVGLLNGVDGRGRDSRDPSSSSSSFRPKGDIIADPSLRGEGDKSSGDTTTRRLSKELDSDPKQSTTGTARSPRKAAINASKHLVDSPSTDGQSSHRENANSNGNVHGKATRGVSPDSTQSGDYHSALSDNGRGGSVDDYMSDEEDDDKSGTYRGSRSTRTTGKSVKKRQTRTGGASLKRKRNARASSPIGRDE